MTAIRITVTRTAGSAPREAGTAMLVWADRTEGTIGGGALEWDAMAQARTMLADGTKDATKTVPLGPALGQCCGGAVTLQFEAAAALHTFPGAPLWIYGAGHVGRALTQVLAPLPDYDITLVDTSDDRFGDVPAGITKLVAADPARIVQHAPKDAHHLILTYSHAIDLELCHAVLRHGFATVGLIGSATKWARFRGRLADLGHRPEQIARIACPIGDPNVGKHPQAIAIGVAMSMLGAVQGLEAKGTG